LYSKYAGFGYVVGNNAMAVAVSSDEAVNTSDRGYDNVDVSNGDG